MCGKTNGKRFSRHPLTRRLRGKEIQTRASRYVTGNPESSMTDRASAMSSPQVSSYYGGKSYDEEGPQGIYMCSSDDHGSINGDAFKLQCNHGQEKYTVDSGMK